MSTSKRVIKNTLYLYIRMAVSILVNIFTTRILLQALGASDYGLYNVVGGAISILGFLTASMSSSTQRFISYAEGGGNFDEVKEIFNNALAAHYGVALITGFILALSGFIFFNGVLNIPDYRETVAKIIYLCMIVSTVFSITIVPYDALLNAHENMKFYSIVGILDVFFKLTIASIVFFTRTDKLMLYGILMAVESWLVRLITQQYCKHHYTESQNVNIRKYVKKERLKEMFSFAGWNMANIASGVISLYGMSIVVNHFFGTTLNAALGIATQLSGVLMGVSMNMVKAITPVLAKREGGHHREQTIEITYIGCKFSFLLFAFFCIPTLFFMDRIIEIWLHNIPDWTILFCRILICSSLIEQLFLLLYQTIIAHGEIKQYNVTRSICNILPILLSIVMLECYNFPPYIVLVNWLIFYSFFGGLVNLYYAKVNIGLSIKTFFFCVISVGVKIIIIAGTLNYFLLLLQKLLSIEPIIFYLISMILSIPLYWKICLTAHERNILLNFIRRR